MGDLVYNIVRIGLRERLQQARERNQAREAVGKGGWGVLSQPPHVAEVIAPIIARARLVAPDAATFVALAVDIVQAEGGQHERARCPNQ